MKDDRSVPPPRRKSARTALTITHPNAAGIDIGSTSHFVAVPADRDAHKLARLIYTMLTKGEEYVDLGQEYYEERYRARVLHQLEQRAQRLGMTLVANERPA